MMDVGRHPKIELVTNAEIEDITGYVGNFKARIRKKARYVDEEACINCGDCVAVCPVVVADEYQMGLSIGRRLFGFESHCLWQVPGCLREKVH
jgi:heterodisulfide reductase subunit A